MFCGNPAKISSMVSADLKLIKCQYLFLSTYHKTDSSACCELTVAMLSEKLMWET